MACLAQFKVLATLILSLAACSPPPDSLTVAAAISLREPLIQLAAAAAAPPPQFSFASSGALASQIAQGAPVDVFLSASPRQLDRLETCGLLLKGSRRELLTNRLMLVVPERQPLSRLRFQDLSRPSIARIAIGDATVPAGDYARETLGFFGLAARLEPKLIPLGSVRAVAVAVAAGNVDAGLLYASEVRPGSGLRVVDAAPEASHRPIRYAGAVTAASRQPDAARAYLASLTAATATAAFQRQGLIPLTRP